MTMNKFLLAILLTVSTSNLTTFAATVKGKESLSVRGRIEAIQKQWAGSATGVWMKLKLGSKAETSARLAALLQAGGTEASSEAVASLTKALETSGVQNFFVRTAVKKADGSLGDASVTKVRTVTALEMVTELANPTAYDQGKVVTEIRVEKISSGRRPDIEQHFGEE